MLLIFKVSLPLNAGDLVYLNFFRDTPCYNPNFATASWPPCRAAVSVIKAELEYFVESETENDLGVEGT